MVPSCFSLESTIATASDAVTSPPRPGLRLWTVPAPGSYQSDHNSKMKTVALFPVVLVCFAAIVSGGQEDCCFKVDTEARQIIDTQGKLYYIIGLSVNYICR